MTQQQLLLRCIAWQEEGQWVALCLDYDLAAQDDTYAGVQARLNEQIRSYLREALVGQDRAHADALLNRRAPLRYWLTYYWALIAHKLRMHNRAREFSSPVPLAPA